jgi:hypothetical protein
MVEIAQLVTANCGRTGEALRRRRRGAAGRFGADANRGEQC